jgi:non-canonical poly(A) RNA polymerase PAPD5/7
MAKKKNKPKKKADKIKAAGYLPKDPFLTETREKIAPRLTPWFKPIIQGQKSLDQSIQRLHNEILEFEKWISPSQEEIYSRRMVIDRIDRLIIKRLWPGGDAKLKVFGSFQTNLFLPSSDIDLVVVVSHSSPEAGKRHPSLTDSPTDNSHSTIDKSGVRRIAKLIRKIPKLALPGSIVMITKARVPIVKFVEYATNFNVDISINIESGLDGAKMVQTCLLNYPVLRPLTLVLKQFLALRLLNEVYRGGLGSYGLLCMLVSFLQMHPSVKSGQLLPEENLGILLMDFLELYGCKFNYQRFGISIRGNGSYFDRTFRNWLPKPIGGRIPLLTLSIEDPQNLENDICKSSYAFCKVKQAFQHAYSSLKDELAKKGSLTSHDSSILGKIIWESPKVQKHRHFIVHHTNL